MDKEVKDDKTPDVKKEKEIRAYLERSVADIARKCGCTQDDVWQRMYTLSFWKLL